MTTISELVEEISFTLHSYTGVKEAMTYLTSELLMTSVQLSVHNSSRISRGIIEIGDELCLVDNAQDGVVTLFPFGRATQGSTAQDWPTNTPVTNDPLFPKVTILRNLKQIVNQIHPELFAVRETEFPWQAARYVYELPADVDRVLEVKYDIAGPTHIWPQAKTWKYIKTANTGDFTSGKALEVRESITPGYTVQVTYAAPFGAVSSTSDTLEDLGIPESSRDVILYGVCYRLMQGMEASRLQMYAVEQMARQEAVQPGAMTNLSRQFYALYTQRKLEERQKLLTLHPMQIHYTR